MVEAASHEFHCIDVPTRLTGDYLLVSSFVAITAVPEPSTLALLGIGGVLACWAARRRGRSRMTERYAGAGEKQGVRRS